MSSSLSDAQKDAIKIVPRITAALSVLGSGFILFNVLIGQQRKRNANNNHQNNNNNNSSSSSNNNSTNSPGRSLLAGLSFADLISSLMYVIGPAAFPSSSGGGYGTEMTCNIQGFLVNLQVGAALYSGFLSWHYCLYIRYHWRISKLQKWYEPLAHCVVWVVVLSIGIGSLVEDLYQPHWVRCYYGSSGQHANEYMWAFFFAPIWFALICGSIALLLIYWEVRRIEAKSFRYSFRFHHHHHHRAPATTTQQRRNSLLTAATTMAQGSRLTISSDTAKNQNSHRNEPGRNDGEGDGDDADTGSNSRGRRSSLLLRGSSVTNPMMLSQQQQQQFDLPKTRRVAYQGLGYTAAFIINYFFPTVSRIIQTMGGVPPYGIRILAVSTVSSQGFWNWLVFSLQPLVMAWMENHNRNKVATGYRTRPRRNSSTNINDNNNNNNDNDDEGMDKDEQAAAMESNQPDYNETKDNSNLQEVGENDDEEEGINVMKSSIHQQHQDDKGFEKEDKRSSASASTSTTPITGCQGPEEDKETPPLPPQDDDDFRIVQFKNNDESSANETPPRLLGVHNNPQNPSSSEMFHLSSVEIGFA